MKILVIGSGGREHALVWKISQSNQVKKIYCAPGNAGIAELAECVAISPQDITELLHFAKTESVDLTVVGPELPLSLGIVDEFEKAGLRVFGPRRNAAIIEASKCFTKDFCNKYNIPTAPYAFFSDSKEAKSYLKEKNSYPIVIKADGLAAGKGVIIAKNQQEAFDAIEDMLVYEKFGLGGRRIVIEDFMPGEEATFMVLTDGENFIPFESCQDHKRVFDNDKGPNTGGMGAYSPAPIVTKEVHQKVCDQIITPFLRGMRDEDRPYRGILYAGLMIADGEPRIVEFNCRFGDPEAEVILQRLKTDLVDLIDASLKGELDQVQVEFSDKPSVCVVLCSKGYPGTYENGKVIDGLEEAKKLKGSVIFHSGTREERGEILTNGGRVLTVTSCGNDLKKAIQNVYKLVDKINFEGMFYRKDIGKKGLKL